MTRATRRYHLVIWLVLTPLAVVVLALGLREASQRRTAFVPPAVGGVP